MTDSSEGKQNKNKIKIELVQLAGGMVHAFLYLSGFCVSCLLLLLLLRLLLHLTMGGCLPPNP